MKYSTEIHFFIYYHPINNNKITPPQAISNLSVLLCSGVETSPFPVMSSLKQLFEVCSNKLIYSFSTLSVYPTKSWYQFGEPLRVFLRFTGRVIAYLCKPWMLSPALGAGWVAPKCVMKGTYLINMAYPLE